MLDAIQIATARNRASASIADSAQTFARVLGARSKPVSCVNPVAETNIQALRLILDAAIDIASGPGGRDVEPVLRLLREIVATHPEDHADLAYAWERIREIASAEEQAENERDMETW